MHRILQENGLHPFHFQRVQQLLPRDEIQRVHFCGGIFDFLFNSFLLLQRLLQRFQDMITINKTL